MLNLHRLSLKQLVDLIDEQLFRIPWDKKDFVLVKCALEQLRLKAEDIESISREHLKRYNSH